MFKRSIMRNFSFNFNGEIGTLSYEESPINEIDAQKYTLFELLSNPKVDYLTCDERIAIFNSWAIDQVARNRVKGRLYLETGCKPIVQVIDENTGELRDIINFGCNDYLNLSTDSRVKQAVHRAVEEYGTGAGATAVTYGNTRLHKELEQKIASFYRTEDALIQTSGYVTNIGVIKAYLRKNDLAIFDVLSHASLIDSSIDSSINTMFFPHNNYRFMEKLLKKVQNRYVNKLVVVESIYSMEGDMADIEAVVDIAQKYGAKVLVDDAHGLGVLGENGRGFMEHTKLYGKVDLITASLSKAVGAIGAFVTGKEDLISYLRYTNRSYLFSTGAYTPSVGAALESLKIIETDHALRKQLWDNIDFFTTELKIRGFDIGPCRASVIPVIIGDEPKVLQMTTDLYETGIIATPVVYPVTSKNGARLRFSMTAGYSKETLVYVLDTLEHFGKIYGVI